MVSFLDKEYELDYKPTPSTTVTCIVNGYHWLDITASYHGTTEPTLAAKFTGIESAKKCQKLCERDVRCNWFNWKDGVYPTGCWLLKNKGKLKKSNLGRYMGSTGPKRCSGTNTCFIFRLSLCVQIFFLTNVFYHKSFHINMQEQMNPRTLQGQGGGNLNLERHPPNLRINFNEREDPKTLNKSPRSIGLTLGSAMKVVMKQVTT